MDDIKAYDEYLEFLTSGPTLEEIIDFKPSQETRERAQYLFHIHNSEDLTQEERIELAEYAKAVYFMEMIKIRARRKLGLRGEE